VTEGAFSTDVTLTAGANVITVIATDNTTNTTTDTRTINYDANPPVITVSGPADNSKTKVGTATVSGSVDSNSTVTGITLNGSPVEFTFNATDGTFRADLSYTYGINTVQVNASDLAANSASESRTVTYDNQNPSLAITDPATDLSTNRSN
jgi:bacillopeptidase F